MGMYLLIFGSLFLAVLFGVLEVLFDGKFVEACFSCIFVFLISLIVAFVVRYHQGRLDLFLIEYDSIIEMVEQGHNNEYVSKKVLEINQTIYNAKLLKEKWMFNKIVFDEIAQLEPIDIKSINANVTKKEIDNGN